MLKQDCYVGQEVVFGRPNGEQTLGKIVRLNHVKAKVKTLEDRGSRSPKGAEWGVPYSMLRPAVANAKQVKADLTYSPGSTDNPIIEAIVGVYSNLSPENLSCDGELSRAQVVAARASLLQQLRRLQAALGREVSEGQAYQWLDAKRQHEQQQCPRHGGTRGGDETCPDCTTLDGKVKTVV